MLPPPRKKLAPPPKPLTKVAQIIPPPQVKPSGPQPFQPNRSFDSEEEIEIWAKTAYKGSTVKVVRTWKTTVINCEITLTPEEKPKSKK